MGPCETETLWIIRNPRESFQILANHLYPYESLGIIGYPCVSFGIRLVNYWETIFFLYAFIGSTVQDIVSP